MHSYNDYNPFVLLVYYTTVAIIAFMCQNLLISGLIMAGGMLHFSLRPGKKKLRSNIFYLLFGMLLAIVNPIFNHRGATVLFVMNDNPITLEALIYGIYSAITIIAILYLFRIFSSIMTSDKIIYMLGKISGRAALTFSMSLRYIPLLRSYTAETGNAMTALGKCSEEGIFDKIKSRLNIFSIVMTRSLENGIITADSMTARGYGTGRRTSFSPIRFKASDLIFLLLTLGLSAVIFTGIALGSTACEFYPEYSAPACNILSYICITATALLAFLPIAADKLSNILISRKISAMQRLK